MWDGIYKAINVFIQILIGQREQIDIWAIEDGFFSPLIFQSVPDENEDVSVCSLLVNMVNMNNYKKFSASFPT